MAYELATGELHAFSAASVVLATGGCGRAFATTSNGHSATGDAMALALRSGLPLQDMEFFQFHPTGLHRLGILVPEAARGEGAVLRNAAGDAFMERYAPLARDLAPADVAARAVVTEIREGRGGSRNAPGGDHVMLDLTSLPASRWGSAMATAAGLAFTQLGIDAETTPLPVHPTAHYAMGGIPTTADGQVLDRDGLAVPGLFAAGESACVSVHGANRLGGERLARGGRLRAARRGSCGRACPHTSGRAAASRSGCYRRFAPRAAARPAGIRTFGADPGGVAADHGSARLGHQQRGVAGAGGR